MKLSYFADVRMLSLLENSLRYFEHVLFLILNDTCVDHMFHPIKVFYSYAYVLSHTDILGYSCFSHMHMGAHVCIGMADHAQYLGVARRGFQW